MLPAKSIKGPLFMHSSLLDKGKKKSQALAVQSRPTVLLLLKFLLQQDLALRGYGRSTGKFSSTLKIAGSI